MNIVARFRGAAVVAVLVPVAAVVSAGPVAAARSETYCESQLNVVYFWTSKSLNATDPGAAAGFARLATWANERYLQAGC